LKNKGSLGKTYRYEVLEEEKVRAVVGNKYYLDSLSWPQLDKDDSHGQTLQSYTKEKMNKETSNQPHTILTTCQACQDHRRKMAS
jgi:uncharacterized protein YkwD